VSYRPMARQPRLPTGPIYARVIDTFETPTHKVFVRYAVCDDGTTYGLLRTSGRWQLVPRIFFDVGEKQKDAAD